MRAEMSQGFDFRFFMAIEASSFTDNVTNLQVSAFGQRAFAADIKGKLDSLGDDSGQGADLKGDAENLFCIFAIGVFGCQVDDILCQAEFVQGTPFLKKARALPGPHNYSGCLL